MPDPVTGVTAAASIGSAAIGSSASKRAGRQQVQAAEAGAAEQRLAREELRKLLEPYVAAGTPALQSMMGAVGLRGPEEQAAFVAQQEQSPIFQALAQQGEQAILQQASATGGLRGGNIQGALAQFRPQLLNQFLEQQYERLGGLTQLGQQSAAGVGASGLTSATNIAELLAQGGAARAGATLGSAQAFGQGLGNLATIGGMYLGRQPQPNLGRLDPAAATLIASNPGIF